MFSTKFIAVKLVSTSVAILLTAGAGARVVTAEGPGQKSFLEAGDRVPPLRGFDLEKRPFEWNYASHKLPTVVYVIVPFTKYVVANEDNFAAVVRAASTRFSFLVLSTDENRLKEYIDKVATNWRGAHVDVMYGITAELKRTMMLGGYPQTLVISPDSIVIKDFMGAYDDGSLTAHVADVEKFFGVRLPGLK